MKYTIIMTMVTCLHLLIAQDITNKLGGITQNETYDVTDSANNILFRVQGDGDVGIGVTNPTHPLEVIANESSGGVGHFVNTVPSSNDYGVYGACDNTDDYGYGGYFEGGFVGAQGTVTPNTDVPNEYWGLFGFVDTETAYHGIGTNIGVRGFGREGVYNYGVRGAAQGFSTSIYNYGIYGYASGGSGDGSSINYGIYAKANGPGTNYAGYFHDGNVKIVNDLEVDGTLSKGGGSFKIDHPLDPENKYLSHSFVESPDMMNIYNGNVILNRQGEAVIEMPDWFEPLNKDFRYQLTGIGGWAPLYIAEEISGNRFKVAGGEPGMKVSWQVTGIRQDAFANANRIQVEEQKIVDERGKYIHPEAFGMPLSMSVNFEQEQRTQLKDVSP